VRSYPTYPPPLTVSYLIQIPEAIRLKVNKCRAPQAPKAPRARAVYVRIRPRPVATAGVLGERAKTLIRKQHENEDRE
jgi:hypothetical protein